MPSLAVADGLMVARGDLGVELSPWQVPVEQKRMIQAAASWRKLVITATPDARKHDPQPHADPGPRRPTWPTPYSTARTLSCSLRRQPPASYPVEAVRMMSRILETAESAVARPNLDLGPAPRAEDEFSIEVAHSAARLAENLNARYIVVYTETGYSAQLISKHHPTCQVVALSRHPEVCHRAKLLWGVRSRIIAEPENLDRLVDVTEALLLQRKWASPGT